MVTPRAVAKISRDKELIAFQNSFGVLYNDETTGPTGRPGHYLRWVWASGSVVVVPHHGDAVGLWSMFRYPVGLTLLEFPRGGVEPGEAVEAAALRELKEETGLDGRSPVIIGRLYPDSGIIGTFGSVVAVEVDRDADVVADREPMESIDAVGQWVDRDAMAVAIGRGDVQCGITIAAWAMFLATQTGT